MNIAVKHMMRNRRQREGRRPTEPVMPVGPENWQDNIHPGFAFQRKEEHEQRNNLFLPPAYEVNAPEELVTSYQDAPDPLRQSNFFANGNKIRPWAHIRVPTYLAMSEWESVADDEFRAGKLSSMGYHVVPQYHGSQLPVDITPLIPEAQYTTYGAMTQLPYDQSGGLPGEDAYLYG